MTDEADGERVTWNEDGTLDEVVGEGGAHLEHMDGNRWYLSIGMKDGTSAAFWFSSKDLKRPFWEMRDAPDKGYALRRAVLKAKQDV